MVDIIMDAGLADKVGDSTNGFKPTNLRRATIQEIRSKLRKVDASDDDWDDAIDALIELSRDPGLDE